ncbi:MAG: TMEM175 family protein [Dermatophilaceae bacterium]
MRTSRLEAFSDGVLAIIITIMVLELKVPHEPTLAALGASATGFLTYALSFVYIGIYWSNHHHMFQVVERVNGTVLWANLDLLFWLSLFPFTTAWVDETTFSRTPVVVYGINLLLAAVAYYVLQRAIFRVEGGSGLRQALGRDLKGKISPVLYLSGIAVAFVTPWLGVLVFTSVAIMWLVPDRRVERYLAARESTSAEGSELR